MSESQEPHAIAPGELWFSSSSYPSSSVEEQRHFATSPLPPDIFSRNEGCFVADDDDDEEDVEILSDSEVSDVDVDNEWFDTQQYESDASVESLESWKQNKWLCPFFDMLNNVSTEQNPDEDSHYYCPACRGSGLGETDLYKGLQPLIAHAKHFTKRRVNLHRKFAAILEADQNASELSERSDFAGLIHEEEMINPCIIWPPIVVIQSVGCELEEKQQWLGMRSKELLEMFDKYSPLRVRHAYDSTGCRGSMALVMFPDSPLGYIHAKLLAKHFKCSERGRKDFLQYTESNGVTQPPGSIRLFLYGYLATKEDMGVFEESDSSKKKVKWVLRRYGDVILQPLTQMHRSMTEVHRLKAKLQEQVEHNIVLEKALRECSKKIELEEGCVVQQNPMHYLGELTKETSEKEA